MLIAVKECKKSCKNWLNSHLSTSIHYGKVLNGSGNVYKDDIVAWQNCSKHNGRIFLISKKDILSEWTNGLKTIQKCPYHHVQPLMLSKEGREI